MYYTRLDLYIPIWFYSNSTHAAACFFTYVFTFQSGSILMLGTFEQIPLPAIFTFQSGSILIGTAVGALIGAGVFTFQSGSILIRYSLTAL
mgnify:CR=1 FL=1